MSSVLHSIHSSRRAAALKDADYDHEIYLIDHTKTQETARSRSRSASESNHRDSLQPPDDSSGRRHSDDQLRKRLTIREEIERRRYSKPKYQKGRLGDDLDQVATAQDSEPSFEDVGNRQRGSSLVVEQPQIGELLEPIKNTQTDPESAIDILYENQRGCFLCGVPLFSSRALGAADKPPWTNAAQKASATNITNAQCPDPTWRWVSKEWKVNHQDNVDDDGWEYSFMFSKRFSWHGPAWYSSFVRRRAWIRKRVKKDAGYQLQEVHRLNSDYFTIRPSISRSRSPSKAPSVQDGRYSIGQLAKRDVEGEQGLEDIHDIETLMKALKLSRIDREKTEAVENFIKNGDELSHLGERMHDIMSLFIFQASRRSLLAYLSNLLNEETDHHKENVESGEEDAPAKRIENLDAAVRAADAEVKGLEYWSDVKEMVTQGETHGAVDESQEWDREKWVGVDDSGPKVAASGESLVRGSEAGNNVDKGKGKAPS